MSSHITILHLLPFSHPSPLLPLLQHHNQQHQNRNQHPNSNHLLILPRLPRHPPQPPPRPLQPAQMPLHMPINLIQHQHMLIQLVAHPNTQLPLPPDAFAQLVQVLVLVPQHRFVVFVDLDVVETAGGGGGRGGVAVGEEGGAGGG